jgi:hypothetical protein
MRSGEVDVGVRYDGPSLCYVMFVVKGSKTSRLYSERRLHRDSIDMEQPPPNDLQPIPTSSHAEGWCTSFESKASIHRAVPHGLPRLAQSPKISEEARDKPTVTPHAHPTPKHGISSVWHHTRRAREGCRNIQRNKEPQHPRHTSTTKNEISLETLLNNSWFGTVEPNAHHFPFWGRKG